MMNADLLRSALSDARQAIDTLVVINLGKGSEEDAERKVAEADSFLSEAKAKLYQARA